MEPALILLLAFSSGKWIIGLSQDYLAVFHFFCSCLFSGREDSKCQFDTINICRQTGKSGGEITPAYCSSQCSYCSSQCRNSAALALLTVTRSLMGMDSVSASFLAK